MSGLDLPRPLDWMTDALCTQTDPEVFFPKPGRSILAAKRVCSKCEVRDDCLDWAMTTGEPWGVLGGLGESERRRLRGVRRRHGDHVKCAVCGEAMLESSVPRHMQRRHEDAA